MALWQSHVNAPGMEFYPVWLSVLGNPFDKGSKYRIPRKLNATLTSGKFRDHNEPIKN